MEDEPPSHEPPSHDVLRSNQSLREWAAGLRQWSKCARDASSAERVRAHDLLERASVVRRPADTATRPRAADPAAEPVLPGLGEVSMPELVSILVDRHGMSPVHAVKVLSTATVAAGYPAGYDRVSAVDAFGILEWALHDGA